MGAPGIEVSAVIVTWNTRELLRECLASFEPHVRSGRVEVCVVDNASTDGSAELVEREFPWAALEACEDNSGFGPAVNRGAARGSGRWVAIANADIALEDGALEHLLAAGAADPGAGALAPRLVLPDGSAQHSVFAFPSLPFSVLFNLGAGSISRSFAERNVLIGAWDPDRPRRVPWAVAAFLLVRREAFDRVGGFDEHQWMYAEDLDLGWRLAQAGWATRYVPEARVRHQSGASTIQVWGDERQERWQRSTYAWMLRRRGPLRTRATAAVNVAGCLVRWAVLAAAARARPSWGHRRDTMARWARAHAQGLASARSLREHR